MHFTKSLVLGLATLSTAVLGDRCHTQTDVIGGYCAYKTIESFLDAATKYCERMEGVQTYPSRSWPLYIKDQADGYGGTQHFWGNYRVDRDPAPKIGFKQCKKDMEEIFIMCGGYGGWRNKPYGTVFGECIRK